MNKCFKRGDESYTIMVEDNFFIAYSEYGNFLIKVLNSKNQCLKVVEGLIKSKQDKGYNEIAFPVIQKSAFIKKLTYLLINAIEQGSIEAVQILLRKGVQVNRMTIHRWLPLVEACERINRDYSRAFEIVKLLIKHGAEVNKKDGYHRKALDWIGYNLEVTQLFIETGIDVNIEISKGNTPLHLASYDDEIVTYLLGKGADPNIQNSDGNIPLHSIFYYSQEWKDDNKKLGFIPSISLIQKSNINIKNKNGNTPLHLAVERESIEGIKLLLQQKPDLTIKNKKGKKAIDLCHTELIKKIFESKLNEQ